MHKNALSHQPTKISTTSKEKKKSFKEWLWTFMKIKAYTKALKCIIKYNLYVWVVVAHSKITRHVQTTPAIYKQWNYQG